MPVTTTMLAPTESPTAHHHQPTSCNKCQECGTRVVVEGTSVLYWPVALDKDLLQTISSLFPHWFKDCINDLSKMSGSTDSRRGSNEGGLPAPFIPLSPPKCEVDDSPLQGKALNKNKESLKVKLMLRRPREDLVSRGVIPPMNTPAAFYEQRQRLDMAKKHDILKQKMQRRPLREELVRQHILEDSPGNIDPSLVEKQKQLKRARIADAINDHLCQRPGPLELVKANILHTSEDLEKAVKEGQLMFKSTCEGEPRKHPSLYLTYDDESSSEGGMSPEQSEGGSGRASKEPSLQSSQVILDASSLISNLHPITSTALIQPTQSSIAAAIVASTMSSSLATSLASGMMHLTTAKEIPTPSPSLTSNTSSLSPLSSLASPQHTFLPSPQTPITQTLLVTQTPLPHALTTPPLQNSAPGKDQSKSRKKSKGKCQPKARTIKFHEYKGPPSAVKREHNSSPTETSYDILLQQQQLFLQCQLELKQKYTQIILPASLKSEDLNSGVTLSSVLTLASSPALSSISNSSSGNTPIAPAPPNHNSSSTPPAPPPPPIPPDKRLPAKLEELKVSDLKIELKRRNLPVSGSKPQLIERLRFHTKTFGTFNFNTGKSNNISTSNSSSNATTVSTKDTPKTTFVAQSNRTSIDLTDDSSVVGLFDSSMEAGEDSVLSPAYSHISSTRPSSVAPMEVDFDSAMDVSDLGPLTPLNPATPHGANSNDSGSINTPPPPPPPPPPPVSNQSNQQISGDNKDNGKLHSYNNNYNDDCNVNAQMVLVNNALRSSLENRSFSFNSENQEGILHLTKKIEDLQRELHNTQMQLQMQQKQNMLKAKENYQNNISDPKFNQKAILQHQIDSRRHQQKQQLLQSHLLQLQQNLQNEQRQLQKNADEDDDNPTKDLDDLIIISTNHNHMQMPMRSEPVKQNHPQEQQQQFVNFQHSQQEPLNELRSQQTLQSDQNSRGEQMQHELFQIGDFQFKVDGNWEKSIGPTYNLGLVQKNQRSSSIASPNGIISSHHRTSSLPNFSGIIFTNENLSNISENQYNNEDNVFSGDNFERENEIPKEQFSKNDINILNRLGLGCDFNIKPPPNYSEATKSFKSNEHIQQSSNENFRKPSYKSQQVDDVLEILIKNGELPPSAAQDPITPTTSHGGNNDPFFMSINTQSPTIPPPPPPPPPPSSSSHKQMGSSQNSFPSLSSPSLFADLVMGGNSPAHLDLPIDLDLPVLEGMDMGSLESHVDPSILQQQVMNSILGRLEQKPCMDEGVLPDIKMEVGEDVDVSSWLDSLVPSSLPPNSNHYGLNSSQQSWNNVNPTLNSSSILYNKSPDSAISSGVCSMRSSSSASSSTTSSSSGLSLNQCDPLLCSNPDQMDLFSMEDVDLRPPHATSDLSWDRIDFPT